LSSMLIQRFNAFSVSTSEGKPTFLPLSAHLETSGIAEDLSRPLLPNREIASTSANPSSEVRRSQCT
jgi:hypothetical protein